MTITEDTRPALGLPQIQSLAAADMAAVTAPAPPMSLRRESMCMSS